MKPTPEELMEKAQAALQKSREMAAHWQAELLRSEGRVQALAELIGNPPAPEPDPAKENE